MYTSMNGWLAMVAVVVALAGCKRSADGVAGGPGTPEGARAVVEELIKPGVDRASLLRSLQPAPGDYARVFTGDAAGRAEAGYKEMWSGSPDIPIKPDQTEIRFFSATAEELRAGTGEARSFPGGYKEVAPMLAGGVRLYAFDFVRPGQRHGMAVDGLTYVDGHWALFPKPWRVLK